MSRLTYHDRDGSWGLLGLPWKALVDLAGLRGTGKKNLRLGREEGGREYGQSSITFQAMIKSGRDLMRGRMAGVTRWGDLSVRYAYIEPQRVPL